MCQNHCAYKSLKSQKSLMKNMIGIAPIRYFLKSFSFLFLKYFKLQRSSLTVIGFIEDWLFRTEQSPGCPQAHVWERCSQFKAGSLCPEIWLKLHSATKTTCEERAGSVQESNRAWLSGKITVQGPNSLGWAWSPVPSKLGNTTKSLQSLSNNMSLWSLSILYQLCNSLFSSLNPGVPNPLCEAC